MKKRVTSFTVNEMVYFLPPDAPVLASEGEAMPVETLLTWIPYATSGETRFGAVEAVTLE